MRLFRTTTQSEAERQDRVLRYLILRDWQVKITVGTALSYGWPDIYTAHKRHGPRWIEMKKPGEKLRDTQIDFITQFALVDVGVWVLTEANPTEYRKLFYPPNWHEFI